ncbi:MAG: FAD-dependent oxidoreductase [Clostridia bacterium]|nr:FAD-dependent oxidoreductase [Clostridia bacterium]
MSAFPALASPFKIGSVTLKNRFCMAPMGGLTHYLPDGSFKPEAIEYYIARAKGGFALIFTGAMGTDAKVDPYDALGTIVGKNPGAFKTAAMEMNGRAESYGCHMFGQISMGLGRNYAGLYSVSKNPVWGTTDVMSPELTKEQIKQKVEQMVEAAKIVQESGFSGCEVHAIHWGYLLDQFAMSLTNHREDEYGGSLENRMRVCKEIVEGIKQTCGDKFPVSIRFGLKTFIKNWNEASLDGSEEAGRTIEEGVKIAKLLEGYGYDALSTDVGTYDSFYYACPPMYMPKGFFNSFAAQAKEAVSIPILAAGRMNDWELDEKGIEEGMFDAIVLARPALADPDLPNKILSGHPEEVRPCLACNQGCLLHLFTGEQPSCAVNPTAQREVRWALKPAVDKKKVVIVGGGAAGMEAARVLGLRGHEVDLYEKSGELGGMLIPSGNHDFKQEVHLLNDWYRLQLDKLPVNVHLNTEVTPEEINNMDADVVILAVGSSPVRFDLPGMDDPMVKDALEVLANPDEVGDSVIVLGGGLTGCELALDFAQHGKDVTIVEALLDILSSGGPQPVPNVQMLRDLLAKHEVKILTDARLAKVEDGKAVVKTADGEKDIAADTLVVAVGFRPVKSMRDEIAEGPVIFEIGDAQEVATILHAIWQGYEVGNNI